MQTRRRIMASIDQNFRARLCQTDAALMAVVVFSFRPQTRCDKKRFRRQKTGTAKPVATAGKPLPKDERESLQNQQPGGRIRRSSFAPTSDAFFRGVINSRNRTPARADWGAKLYSSRTRITEISRNNAKPIRTALIETTRRRPLQAVLRTGESRNGDFATSLLLSVPACCDANVTLMCFCLSFSLFQNPFDVLFE